MAVTIFKGKYVLLVISLAITFSPSACELEDISNHELEKIFRGSWLIIL